MNRHTLMIYGFAVFAGLLILNGYMEALAHRWLWAAGFWLVGGYGAWMCWKEYRAL